MVVQFYVCVGLLLFIFYDFCCGYLFVANMTGTDDSLQSISTQLDEKSYMYWSYVFRNFFRGKAMWSYIIGVKAKPLGP